MQIKVSDYIFNTLKSFGVETVFCITGGASAHLIDSARLSGLECVHNYHEQACAMAADAYARIKKKPAVVLVTNGPGSSNTITGILAAYQDSIPMIVISGQVPTRQTMGNSGVGLRQFGVQEADIISMVKGITKFSAQIQDASEISGCLSLAFRESTTARMGPIWIDIPLDIQNSYISESDNATQQIMLTDNDSENSPIYSIGEIYEALRISRRPVIVAGSAIHLASCEFEFHEFVQHLSIPVVCTWSATDLFAYSEKLYVGNFGILGERAANLALQNADLLLILGSRMSVPNIGYATELFSPKSTKIMVDIDSNEIRKKSLKIDISVVSDIRSFLKEFLEYKNPATIPTFDQWISLVRKWKDDFDLNKEQHTQRVKKVNSYDFIACLSESLPSNAVVVTDMGTSFTCTMQALRNNGTNRLITSPGCSPMGFGLPGAIGAYFADKKKNIICIAGDGGFQMNIQELQTVVTNKISLKIFILNSNGYLAISNMQDNLFEGNHFGSTPASGVDAPNFVEIAHAYGIRAHRVESIEDLEPTLISQILELTEPYLCEIVMPSDQLMIPKLQSTKDSRGGFVSSSLDDMFPYLSGETKKEIINSVEAIN